MEVLSQNNINAPIGLQKKIRKYKHGKKIIPIKNITIPTILNKDMNDDEISSKTSKRFEITAEGKVKFKAGTITLKTPDEIKIY